jgi:hypothetical protein
MMEDSSAVSERARTRMYKKMVRLTFTDHHSIQTLCFALSANYFIRSSNPFQEVSTIKCLSFPQEDPFSSPEPLLLSGAFFMEIALP